MRWYSLRLLCAFAPLICSLHLALLAVSGEAGEPTAVAARVGQQSILYPDGYGGLHYFSDEPISILSERPFRFLMVAANFTVLMEGTSIDTARPLGKVLEPGAGDAFDNGYAGISAVYWSQKSEEWLAFYHAEDHVGLPHVPYNKDLQGMYASVGLAVSKDGHNFRKIDRIITASIPKEPANGFGQGVGDVSVCAEHTNTYLYAYYTDWTRKDKRPVQICMARSRISDGARPGTWRKHFHGAFDEPGLGGNDTPVVKGPSAFACDAWGPHVTYLRRFKKYLIVFTVTAYSDQKQAHASKTGVYYACSEDGIDWSEPQLLFAVHCIPYNDGEVVMHPGLFIEKETAKKAVGWLIYGYSPRFGTAPPRQPHYLARRPITLTMVDPSASSTSQKKPARP